MGLFQYNPEKKTLECPYIWLWVITRQSDNLFIKQMVCGNLEAIQHHITGDAQLSYFLPSWQQWEVFNASFRCLKSIAFNGQTTRISTLHSGAKFDESFHDFGIYSTPLSLVQASRQYGSKSGGPDEILHEKGRTLVSECKDFILNAAGAPAGDGWCGFRSTVKGSTLHREVHQYKFVVDDALTEELLESERNKAAAIDDVFLMFTTHDSFNGKIPRNSGIVCKSNFLDYYGIFAGRVFYMLNTLLPDPNTASRFQLETVEGIGPAFASRIIDNRPYQSLEQCHNKTKIPLTILQKLNWHRSS